MLNEKITKQYISEGYDKIQSIAEQLPWRDYDTESQCFLLEDGVSVAAIFEITDISCEGRGQKFIDGLQRKFECLIKDSIPQKYKSPYVLQIYLEDIKSFREYKKELKNYVKAESKLTKEYLEIMNEHCDYLLSSGGIFYDSLVSNNQFSPRKRVVRAVIYRKVSNKTSVSRELGVIGELNSVCTSFERQVAAAGSKITRYGKKEFLDWMIRWFNPSPKSFESVDELLSSVEKSNSNQSQVFGYDFAEQVFFNTPESNEEKGYWIFDGIINKYMPVVSLSSAPNPGQLSAELEVYGKHVALFDLFPEDTVFVITIVVQEQSEVKEHIAKIEKSALGNGAEADITKRQCRDALYQIADGNFLFPTSFGVYIRAKNDNELAKKEQSISSTLINNGFRVIDEQYYVAPLKTYLSNLPMAYDYNFDKDKMYLSKLVYSSHIASILPFYGRYRGSGKHLYNYLNRLGEPFSYDILDKHDKSFCSHVLTIGTTGSGKSAATVWKIIQLVATYNARVFIVEAGNSFDMLMEYLKSYGISTNDVVLKKGKMTSLNPFSEAYKILEKGFVSEERSVDDVERNLNTLDTPLSNDEKNIDEERDILGEMLLAAELMITGGEQKELDEFSRQDRFTVVQALKLAAKTCIKNNKPQVLTEDVVTALKAKASEPGLDPSRSKRILAMAESMEFFTEDDIGRELFNTAGDPWPDVDVTRLDLGIMKNEGYEAHLGISFMGAANKFLAICEATQFSGRPTVFFCDECHLILQLPVPAAAATKISKMSRKINLWLNFLTQNVGDFSDSSHKMLSMFEFYECLGISENELRKIKEFKPLTEEQINLFLSVRKEIGKYIEGVVISPKINGLFRNVPPRLALALAQSDPDEKQYRRKLMNEFNITETQAAERVAKEMLEAVK